MLFTILLCAGMILADRWVKYIMTVQLAPSGSMPVIPGIIEFRYLENNGAAFNLLAGKQTLLIVVTGAALLVGAYILLFKRPKDKLEYVAIMMIFSGGVGNLIDRIANGYVVDYLNLLFMDFAIFNLADCFVCVGFAILVFAVFRAEYRERKKEKQLAVIDGDAADAVEASEAEPSSEKPDGTD